jgi:hypothetical protein
MLKPISYFRSIFRKNRTSKVVETEKTVNLNFSGENSEYSHVYIVQYIIKRYFINETKLTFTSADIFNAIRKNREDQMLKTLTVQQLRRALYKLRLKNAIYKQQIVLDSKKESNYNIYCINSKYNW